MTPSDRLSHSHFRSLVFRSTRSSDGAAAWRLVKAAGALELNSPYFYLLFVTDFGDTCLVAEDQGELVGLVIGYHPPRESDTAFVWQVGVLPAYRGQGLGLRLLQAWLQLPANAHRRWVTATVAEDNVASQALFRRLAAEHHTGCQVQPHFTSDLFPLKHPAEPLYRVGPIVRGAPPRA